MTKKEAGDKAGAPEVPGPTMRVRRGRYVGGYTRAWQSVPFGETMVTVSGKEYEVRETFAYIWEDRQFAPAWEWEEGFTDVPAVNEGQIIRRQ